MPSKIITDAQKDLIIKDYLSKPQTISEIAKRYNLSSPTIVKILGIHLDIRSLKCSVLC